MTKMTRQMSRRNFMKAALVGSTSFALGAEAEELSKDEIPGAETYGKLTFESGLYSNPDRPFQSREEDVFTLRGSRSLMIQYGIDGFVRASDGSLVATDKGELSYRAVFGSTDNGETYRPRAVNDENPRKISTADIGSFLGDPIFLRKDSDGNLWMATEHVLRSRNLIKKKYELFMSPDNGYGWGLMNEFPDAINICDMKFHEGKIHLVTGIQPKDYVLDEEGKTIHTIEIPLIKFSSYTTPAILTAFHIASDGRMIAGDNYGAGIQVSEDGGRTWQRTELAKRGYIHTIYSKNDEIWATIGGSDAILSSSDGVHWKKKFDGPYINLGPDGNRSVKITLIEPFGNDELVVVTSPVMRINGSEYSGALFVKQSNKEKKILGHSNGNFFYPIATEFVPEGMLIASEEGQYILRGVKEPKKGWFQLF